MGNKGFRLSDLLKMDLIKDYTKCSTFRVDNFKCALTYMRFMQMIEAMNYHRCRILLPHREWSITECYEDGRIQCHRLEEDNWKDYWRDEDYFDTFSPKEFLECILDILSADERMIAAVGPCSPEELMNRLESYIVPFWLYSALYRFYPLGGAQLLVENQIYYFYVMWSEDNGNLQRIEAYKYGDEQFRGHEELLTYGIRSMFVSPDKKYLYGNYREVDAFYVLDLREDKGQIIHGKTALGCMADGRLVIRCGLDVYLCEGKEERKLITLDEDADCEVKADYLLINSKSIRRWWPSYMVDCDGKKRECDIQAKRKELWDYLIHHCADGFSLWRKKSRISAIKDDLMIRKTPAQFHIAGLLEAWQVALDKDFIERKVRWIFKHILKVLLTAGVDPYQDITDLLCVLLDYNARCYPASERFRGFTRDYFFLLRRLSRRPDFLQMLMERPAQLFAERLRERELEVQKYTTGEYYCGMGRECVGTFDWRDGRLVTDKVSVKQARIHDNKALYPGSADHRGRVYYCQKKGRYYVEWLEGDEHVYEAVCREFCLDDWSARMQVVKRNAWPQGRENVNWGIIDEE